MLGPPVQTLSRIFIHANPLACLGTKGHTLARAWSAVKRKKIDVKDTTVHTATKWEDPGQMSLIRKVRPKAQDFERVEQIMEWHSTIRGHVKDKVADKVAIFYGFQHGMEDTTIQANKDLAEVLLEDDGYMYQDVEKSMGIYTHLILQEVKFVIQRWTSGRHVKGIAFAEASFHDVYTRHLNGLEAWQTFSPKSAKSLTQLKQNLHDNGKIHAWLPIKQDDLKPHFNLIKFGLAEKAIDESDED
ncbi:hypothetical protein JB92DRAFT_2837671 [Gautieria morchelliformis]|nr:hypothetical protein JB92DRAFT_2837671 [Gautieria morchelliformis]